MANKPAIFLGLDIRIFIIIPFNFKERGFMYQGSTLVLSREERNVLYSRENSFPHSL